MTLMHPTRCQAFAQCALNPQTSGKLSHNTGSAVSVTGKVANRKDKMINTILELIGTAAIAYLLAYVVVNMI